MNAWRLESLRRWIVGVITVAMLLPSLSGCVTKPPATVRLDGIVVDGQRLARPTETGLVRVMRSGSVIEARVGMELLPGDRVETGPTADIVIRYPSGSEVFMRPNSSGRIGSFTQLIGEVFVKVKGLFAVETAFVKAGARGTAYLVRAGSRGEATVIVFDGTVEVESPTSAWTSVAMGAGSRAVAHPRAPQPVPASADELRITREWVERIEKLVPAQTGVSGTGVTVGLAIGALVGAILLGRDRDKKSRPSDGLRDVPRGSVDAPTPTRPPSPSPSPSPSPPAGPVVR